MSATQPTPCPLGYYGTGECDCGQHRRQPTKPVSANPFGYAPAERVWRWDPVKQTYVDDFGHELEQEGKCAAVQARKDQA